MKDQLIKLMEAEGMSPSKFADEIGVQRSSISHILSGRNKPSYDFLSKILNRFSGINAEWLLTGKGSMIKGSDDAGFSNNKQQSLFNQKKEEKVIEFSGNTEKVDTNGNEERTTRRAESENRELSYNNSNKIQYTNVNNAKYILVFYDDGSFEQFKPRD